VLTREQMKKKSDKLLKSKQRVPVEWRQTLPWQPAAARSLHLWLYILAFAVYWKLLISRVTANHRSLLYIAVLRNHEREQLVTCIIIIFFHTDQW